MSVSSCVVGDTRRQQTGLFLLLAACLMTQPLATDLYLPSLPHIASHFSATPAAAQQTLSLFVLGFAFFQLVGGPLSDRYGRRPLLLGGLSMYGLASLVCLLAPTLEILIAARFVQAIGCCTVVVVARVVVHDIYPGAQAASAFARINTVYALAPLLGPLLGAYLQVRYGWRAAFAVFAAVGVLLAAMAYFRFQETHVSRPRRMAPTRLIGGFARILREPVFWIFSFAGALSFGSIFVFLSGGSFLLINVFEIPTRYAGLFFAGGALGYMLGSMVCQRWIARLGAHRTLRMGLWLAFAACMVYPVLAAAGLAHWSVFLLSQCLVMFAHGINFPCAQSAAVMSFPGHMGAAAALMGCLVMVAAFLLGALVGWSYDATPYPLAYVLVAVAIAFSWCARLLRRCESAA